VNRSFYDELEPIERFSEILNFRYYAIVPKDWSIVITDIVNSTKAIEEGKYKDVNIAGGLTTIAISNHLGSMEFPFVFGGDGAIFLIPNEFVSAIRSILASTKTKVQKYFNLNLRVGLIPIKEIPDPIYVAKWRVSDYYSQAILQGKGIDYAEEKIKSKDSTYLLPEDEPVSIEANFQGFTCRWKDIPSDQGETVSLIIREHPDKNPNFSFLEFFKQLESILGREEEYHPLKEATLEVASSKKVLGKESLVQSDGSTGFKNFLKYLKILLETYLVRFAIFTNIPIKVFFYKLNELKKYNIISSDFRKYDGSLKMVIAISPHKRKALEEFLKSEEAKKNILYGIHKSDRALLTCLLHAEATQEVHFVDGADGGYALAAKMLKSKL